MANERKSRSKSKKGRKEKEGKKEKNILCAMTRKEKNLQWTMIGTEGLSK